MEEHLYSTEREKNNYLRNQCPVNLSLKNEREIKILQTSKDKRICYQQTFTIRNVKNYFTQKEYVIIQKPVSIQRKKNIGNGKMKVNIQFIFLMLITLKDN